MTKNHKIQKTIFKIPPTIGSNSSSKLIMVIAGAALSVIPVIAQILKNHTIVFNLSDDLGWKVRPVMATSKMKNRCSNHLPVVD